MHCRQLEISVWPLVDFYFGANFIIIYFVQGWAGVANACKVVGSNPKQMEAQTFLKRFSKKILAALDHEHDTIRNDEDV